ncbi:hypothetical protein F5B20DRAFT_537783 [Whalleya microplaca]|nr:hypothetical protein F5B20DRAFT_537783 [Whalleya microplaca]
MTAIARMRSSRGRFSNLLISLVILGCGITGSATNLYRYSCVTQGDTSAHQRRSIGSGPPVFLLNSVSRNLDQNT